MYWSCGGVPGLGRAVAGSRAGGQVSPGHGTELGCDADQPACAALSLSHGVQELCGSRRISEHICYLPSPILPTRPPCSCFCGGVPVCPSCLHILLGVNFEMFGFFMVVAAF